MCEMEGEWTWRQRDANRILDAATIVTIQTDSNHVIHLQSERTMYG